MYDIRTCAISKPYIIDKKINTLLRSLNLRRPKKSPPTHISKNKGDIIKATIYAFVFGFIFIAVFYKYCALIYTTYILNFSKDVIDIFCVHAARHASC